LGGTWRALRHHQLPRLVQMPLPLPKLQCRLLQAYRLQPKALLPAQLQPLLLTLTRTVMACL
jgi:hypothetical protein